MLLAASPVDEIKLKDCSACKLVKYCGVKCQRDHRPQHKRACKQRAAELRDELLFKQPKSTHLGDCPICCLPLSLDPLKSTFMECCSKTVCYGCFCTNANANAIGEMKGSLQPKCPFCRSPLPRSEEESKRNHANDPAEPNSIMRGTVYMTMETMRLRLSTTRRLLI